MRKSWSIYSSLLWIARIVFGGYIGLLLLSLFSGFIQATILAISGTAYPLVLMVITVVWVFQQYMEWKDILW